MKRVVAMVMIAGMISTILTGCGSAEISSESVAETTTTSKVTDTLSIGEDALVQTQQDVKYKLCYPDKSMDFKEVYISDKDIEEINTLVNKLLDEKNEKPDFSYSQKKAREEGSAGGISIYLERYKDGKLEYTVYMRGYNLALKGEHEDAIIEIYYPDVDNVDAFSFDKSDALINLSKALSVYIDADKDALDW